MARILYCQNRRQMQAFRLQFPDAAAICNSREVQNGVMHHILGSGSKKNLSFQSDRDRNILVRASLVQSNISRTVFWRAMENISSQGTRSHSTRSASKSGHSVRKCQVLSTFRTCRGRRCSSDDQGMGIPSSKPLD